METPGGVKSRAPEAAKAAEQQTKPAGNPVGNAVLAEPARLPIWAQALEPDAASAAAALPSRLAVGRPDDPTEQQADRVAASLVGPGGDKSRSSALHLARQPVFAAESALLRKPDGGIAPATVPSPVYHTLRAPGQPLPASTRNRFGPLFGQDFSRVRVHADPAANASARALGAQAFTFGNHIAFADGRYRPDTSAGQYLLAHELTHVVQQTAAGSPPADSTGILRLKPDGPPARAPSAGPAGAPGGAGSGASPATGPRTDEEGFAPLEVPALPANELAARAIAGLKSMGVQQAYVLFVVTDALYAYSNQGKILQTFRLTGPPKVAGFYLHDSQGSYEYREKNGSHKWVQVGWDPKLAVSIENWTTLTSADENRLLSGKIAFVIAPTVSGAAQGATGQIPPPEHVPDPTAAPGSEPSTAGDKGKKPAKEGLKRPLSGSEYEATEGKEANYPAFPAEIRTSSGLVPVKGLGELTMHLDWTYGESELIGAVWNASTIVKYHWERWDITAIANKGKAAMKAEAERRKQTAHDKSAEADDEYVRHDAKQRARDIAEDVQNSVDTIKSGGNPGTSPAERFHDVSTEVNNLMSAPTSAIVSAGGFLVDSVWHTLTKPDNEISLEWKTPGHYLIRCIAYPREHEGHRYLASVATTFIEARDTDYIALNTMGAADAVMDELRAQLAATKDPAKIKQINDMLAELQITAHGSAVEALEVAVRKKTAERDAAIGSNKRRRQDELDALNKQLEIAKRNEENLPPGPDGKRMAHALRPEAAIASEVTGATYPLLLQLVPMSQGERPRWALYDVTAKGDKLGFAYVGQGNDDESAIQDAFRRFAADNDYGRGSVLLHIPDSIPNIANRDLKTRNVRRGDALAKDRLHDLLIVLIALSLFIPGVGEAAMLLGGAMAAEHILERWRNGNLELDASLVTDIISILGAVGSVAGTVSGLRLVEAKNAYALAVESGDATAIESALNKLGTAADIAKAVEIGNEIIGYGGLMWGNIQTLKEIEKINADEAEGRITHSQARSARAKAVLGAIQNHVLMFVGPLHEGGETTGRGEEQAPPAGRQGSEPAARQENAPASEGQPGPGPEAGQGQPAPPLAGGAGAVRGKGNYELRSGATDKPLKVNNPDVFDQMLQGAAARKAAGEAELLPGGSGGQYELDIAGQAGKPATKVQVKLEMVSGFDPASQPHGGEEGPARLDLQRVGGQWEATIRIHEMVRKTDVSRISAHELDEIIEIVRDADPTLSDADAVKWAEEQMKAEVFRPGGPSGGRATAHDRAAARELATAYTDLGAAQATKNGAQQKMLEARIAAMKDSMGLRDPAGARERAQALTDMGVLPGDAAARIRAEAEVVRAQQSAPKTGTGQPARELPVEVVAHILRPESSSKSEFGKKGLYGGHLESELQPFRTNNQATYRLTPVKVKKGSDGATYTAYKQEMLDPATGAVVATAMDGANLLYKTTTTDAGVLFDSGLAAFDAWMSTPTAKTAEAAGGTKNVEWTHAAPSGVEFGGFATFENGTWRIETIYPDSNWVLK